MKKLIIVLGCVIFLSGCNMDAFCTQVIFWGKSIGDDVQQEEQSSIEEQEVVEQTKEETGNREDMDNSERATEPEPKTSEAELLLEASFFNDTVQVDGKNIIQNPTNILALVNKEFALPDGYKADDLIRPNVEFSFSFADEVIEKSLLRKEAADALEKMFVDAKMAGMNLFAVSGYRSYESQENVFAAQVNQLGYEQAALLVALPGNSEHQTGLSIDISSESAQFDLTEQFGETDEGKWLMKNAHRFGFILRYPSGKKGITGYNYEPWHYRYVGVEAATEIYENELTLEEFFQVVKKI